MTKQEKETHVEAFKACLRIVCKDYKRERFMRAWRGYAFIKRMCLLSDSERESLEKDILHEYDIPYVIFRGMVVNYLIK